MKFDNERMFLSDEEKKLIETNAKELREIPYQFKCGDFYTVMNYRSDDNSIYFTRDQVFDKLGAILPFVKENKKNLFAHGFFDNLLGIIEAHIEDIVPSAFPFGFIDFDDED